MLLTKTKKKLSIWEQEMPGRGYLYVDDIVEAIYYFFMNSLMIPSFINIGTGVDISYQRIGLMIISQKVGYKRYYTFGILVNQMVCQENVWM